MNKSLSLLLFSLILFNICIYAQPGSIDLTFNSADAGFGNGDGANGAVNSVAMQPDGRIFIAGNFTSYNGTAISRIARLNSDGTLDVSFDPGTVANGAINAVAIQPDGKIIIGGNFSVSSGPLILRIARLNNDGSLDTTFNPGQSTPNFNALAIQPDGKILAAGINLYRMNTDGSLDTTFYHGNTESGSTIFSLALQPDGKILIGGSFNSYKNTLINRIARLNNDGSIDTAFNQGSGANNIVRSVVSQPDGKIIIGGNFTSYDNTLVNRIARLQSDGSVDTAFTPGSGASAAVIAVALQQDGKLLIGGDFISFNGISIGGLARLNTNGSLDVTFNHITGGRVNSVALQQDEKIIIGGLFALYDGATRNNIARINVNGTLDFGFNTGTGSNNTIHSVALQPDGKIMIGGNFTTYNGITRTRLARLNSDGTLDTTFNPGAGANQRINVIALQEDGKIIIGGNFTAYNGIQNNRIARLNSDGTQDSAFNTGTGASLNVNSVFVQSDGKIMVGGGFGSFNGISRSRIVRLNSDGSLDVSFNPGTGATHTIESVVVQPDGKIVIAGNFVSYNGASIKRIARLNSDGTLDVAFNPGNGADAIINAAAVQTDGKIVIGGDFLNYNFESRGGIVRLNNDGTVDSSFNGLGANGSVKSVVLTSDGRIMIGGDFTAYNGIVINRIARLNNDGAPDATFNPGTGTDNFINSLALQSDEKIIIGGGFMVYDNTGRNRVARINGQLNVVLNIKTIIEGFYNGSGLMQALLYQLDPQAYTTDVCDSITVELHNAASPYDLAASLNTLVKVDGTVHALFPPTVAGNNYYIVLRHRNSIETWSKMPVTMSHNLIYDFTAPE